jgi:hypothetical protein
MISCTVENLIKILRPNDKEQISIPNDFPNDTEIVSCTETFRDDLANTLQLSMIELWTTERIRRRESLMAKPANPGSECTIGQFTTNHSLMAGKKVIDSLHIENIFPSQLNGRETDNILAIVPALRSMFNRMPSPNVTINLIPSAAAAPSVISKISLSLPPLQQNTQIVNNMPNCSADELCLSDDDDHFFFDDQGIRFVDEPKVSFTITTNSLASSPSVRTVIPSRNARRRCIVTLPQRRSTASRSASRRSRREKQARRTSSLAPFPPPPLPPQGGYGPTTKRGRSLTNAVRDSPVTQRKITISHTKLQEFLVEQNIVLDSDDWKDIARGYHFRVTADTPPQNAWQNLVVVYYPNTRSVVFCGDPRMSAGAHRRLKNFIARPGARMTQHPSAPVWSSQSPPLPSIALQPLQIAASQLKAEQDQYEQRLQLTEPQQPQQLQAAHQSPTPPPLLPHEQIQHEQQQQQEWQELPQRREVHQSAQPSSLLPSFIPEAGNQPYAPHPFYDESDGRTEAPLFPPGLPRKHDGPDPLASSQEEAAQINGSDYFSDDQRDGKCPNTLTRAQQETIKKHGSDRSSDNEGDGPPLNTPPPNKRPSRDEKGSNTQPNTPPPRPKRAAGGPTRFNTGEFIFTDDNGMLSPASQRHEVEFISGLRKGTGDDPSAYLKTHWVGHEKITWEPASSMFRDVPTLVASWLNKCPTSKKHNLLTSPIIKVRRVGPFGKDHVEFKQIDEAGKTVWTKAYLLSKCCPRLVSEFLIRPKKTCIITSPPSNSESKVSTNDNCVVSTSPCLVTINEDNDGKSNIINSSSSTEIQHQATLLLNSIVMPQQAQVQQQQRQQPPNQQQQQRKHQNQQQQPPLRVEMPEAKFWAQTIKSLPLSQEDCIKDLLLILAEINMKTRCVVRLPPFEGWDPLQKLAWSAILFKRINQLWDRLVIVEANNDKLAFLNLHLNWQSIIVRDLLPLTNLKSSFPITKVVVDGYDEERKIGTDEPRPYVNPTTAADYDGEATLANRSAKLFRKGRRKEAKRTMASNGAAPRCQAVADHIATLHPNHHTPPTFTPDALPLEPNVNGLHSIIKKSTSHIKAIDPYGAASDFFKPVVTAAATGNRPPPMRILAHYYDVLSRSSMVSQGVSFISTLGLLAALNKVPMAANIKLIEEKQKPEIRPVNGGPLHFKLAAKGLVNSDSGKNAAENLDNQYSFAKNGMDKIVHILNANYAQDFSIESTDFKCAFNYLKKKAMMETVKTHWPDALDFFQKYYFHPSPILYYHYDNQGAQILRVMWSTEGPRQGCPLGSLAFNLTVGHQLYHPFAELYPHLTMVAATDDAYKCRSNTPKTADKNEWKSFLDSVCGEAIVFKDMAFDIGLEVVPRKCIFLVPVYAPFPDKSTHEHKGMILNITKKGISACGSSCGTDEFKADYFAGKVTAAVVRIGGIDKITQNDPQVGAQLLAQCGNVLLDHLTHTHDAITLNPDDLNRFDDKIMDSIYKGANTDVRTVSTNRRKMVEHLCRTPTSRGGKGLTAINVKAAPKLIASFMASLTDPLLQDASFALKGVVVRNHTRICELLCTPSIDSSHPLASILPLDPADMIYDPSNPQADEAFTNTRGVAGAIISNIQRIREAAVKLEARPTRYDSESRKSDFVHLVTLSSFSQLSRVFNVNLGDKRNFIPPNCYRAFDNWYMTTPQTSLVPHLNRSHIGYDYPVSLSRTPRGSKVMDASGNFACSSSAANKARYSTHNAGARVFERNARSIGFEVAREPSSFELLGGRINPEQIPKLFPKAPNQATLLLADAVSRIADLISDTTTTARLDLVAQAEDLCNKHAPAPSEQKNARADLALTAPGRSGKIYIFDISYVHSTGITCLDNQVSHCCDILDADLQAIESHEEIPKNIAPSPKVAKSMLRKTKAYCLLNALMNVQYAAGQASSAAVTVPAIFSHRGEMSPQVFRFIETCTAIYKASQKKIRNLDGLTPSQASARYRKRFKDDLFATMAKGWGNQLLAAHAFGSLDSPHS